jgi:hypothetical protein
VARTSSKASTIPPSLPASPGSKGGSTPGRSERAPLYALAIPLWLASLAALIAGLSVWMGFRPLPTYGKEWAYELAANHTKTVILSMAIVALVSAAGTGLAGALTFFRRPSALVWLRHLLIPSYILASFFFYTIIRVTNLINEKMLSLKIGDDDLDPFQICWRIGWNRVAMGAVIVVLLLAGMVHLRTLRRRVIGTFAPIGGRVTVDPQDYAYHNNIDSSFVIHVLLILVLPALLQVHGCGMLEYALPGGGGGGGGGGAPPQVVKVAKKQPKRRKHMSRVNSAITFYIPNINDSQVLKTVEDTTENTYQASTADVGPGGPGSGFGGGGGTGGGWAGGNAGAPILFYRLQYNGTGWDDGMDPNSRADQNFLDELHKASHLKVSEKGIGDHITAADLRRHFKPHLQPPFLYMTGDASIDLSDAETAVIRNYLMGGGLLFADCGSPTWNNSFRAWSKRLFPQQDLVDIANDDPIFHAWFHFPNGAPPLWHHGGSRALGIKQDGRWVVFYSPGDMHDAWKTGHTNAASGAVRQAYELGVNVVKYGIDHYWAMNRQPVKK